MSGRQQRFCWLVLLLLWSPILARADVVGPPPTCPPGAAAAFCHGSTYCEIEGCIGPRDCARGEVCSARDFCMATGTCFGGLGGMSSKVTVVERAGCDGCTRCESHFVCVAGSSSGDAGSFDAGSFDAGSFDAGSFDAGRDAGSLDSGGTDAGSDGPRHVRYCGCAVPYPHAPVPSWLLLVGVGLVWRRRR